MYQPHSLQFSSYNYEFNQINPDLDIFYYLHYFHTIKEEIKA